MGHEDLCFKHCLNGGSCRELGDDRVKCLCPPGFAGTRCHIPVKTEDSAHVHEVDNQAITSMTVTIVSVSIVAVVLAAGIVYLIVVMTRRRRLTSPFKHRRMGEPRTSRGGWSLPIGCSFRMTRIFLKMSRMASRWARSNRAPPSQTRSTRLCSSRTQPELR